MKKNLIVLGFAVLAFASCKQFKKGEGDLQYIIHEDKDGATIKEGDFIALKAIQKTEEDSVLYSSFDFDRPAFLVQQKSAFKGDLYAGLAMLSEGDSATFKINLDSMQAKMGMPKPQNTKGKYMVFNVKIDKVIPKGKMNDQQFQGKVEQFMKAEVAQAKNKEAGKITGYISSKDLKPTVTVSGLNYVINKQGNGPKASVGDTVRLNYTGMFLTGKVFDTSDPAVAKKNNTFDPMRPYEPLKVPAGVNSTIPGFDEALLLFPKGTKATVIIPSKLAYGEQGNQAIPPYTPLVFDIEILDIIKAKPGSTPATPPAVPQMPATR
ncbi:FKBP-type peptidyl-prolyl cis-trans isomerase [Pedobacter sp. SYSU D00535]|uniref:FKBP-type peptidyl-prolyl cis-trans isomerase n=1 Tax=Pedobacter sp. SYSU D00535 TaxID=2810308 RepID=UPI001A979A82|nr:FKBP-type peptidyl-prolyl cis-trans isomerase [Pedobacter sp. SYSU D00535]